jgi:hypothetical protein
MSMAIFMAAASFAAAFDFAVVFKPSGVNQALQWT